MAFSLQKAGALNRVMEAERIQYLVKGYILNALTAVETDELVNYSLMDDGKRLIENVVKEYLEVLTPQAEFDKSAFQHIWKNVVEVDKEVLKHRDTGTQENKGLPFMDEERDKREREGQKLKERDIEVHSLDEAGNDGRSNVVRIWRWVAAAVVIGLMGLGVWWFVKDNKVVEKPGVAVSPTKVHDVAPGREGAILTLADGSKIVLDSAGNGALAVQGKTSIVKQGGEIKYEKGGEINGGEVVYNTMSTPNGRQYSLLLADGSKVWLNAASSIKFPTAFTGNMRVVEITGEAYFEVAHNAAKPFIVSVGDMQVEVLGTHFNINSYTDEPEMKTTLLEGKVRVTKGESIGILKPGQQASVNHANELKIGDADVDQVMAWKNGFFSFEHANIQEIMKQLSRWYDVEVIYQGIPKEYFEGKIDRNLTLSQVLKVLAETKVHYRIEEGKKLIILP